MNPHPPDNAATRERLMAAAGEVFAERGFRDATVREICQRAGANVASVNYHFGDKRRLYAEVIRDAHRAAMSKYPSDLGLEPGASVEQRLHAFVRAFFFRIFDEGRPAWHGKLIAREIADPTDALDDIVDEGIRPHFMALRAIVTELLGGGTPDPDRLRYGAWSVVGQCLFYFHAQPIVRRLHPAQSFGPADIEALARHVTDFSLAGIRAAAGAAAAAAARRGAGPATVRQPAGGGAA
jgi:AcrR family transcriptional regulator